MEASRAFQRHSERFPADPEIEEINKSINASKMSPKKKPDGAATHNLPLVVIEFLALGSGSVGLQPFSYCLFYTSASVKAISCQTKSFSRAYFRY